MTIIIIFVTVVVGMILSKFFLYSGREPIRMQFRFEGLLVGSVIGSLIGAGIGWILVPYRAYFQVLLFVISFGILGATIGERITD